MKFRKKSIVIDAVQWKPTTRGIKKIDTFTGMKLEVANSCLLIPTLEGEMVAQPGDWIIKETFPSGDRQFYPCKPDIFAETYEPMEELKPV